MNGWGACDNVQDTIESTINDAIDWVRLELELSNKRVSKDICQECETPIPLERMLAIKGCEYCVNCQNLFDVKHVSYYNRRGCKDSQLR